MENFVWGTTTWVDSIEQNLGGNGGNTSYTIGMLGAPVRGLRFHYLRMRWHEIVGRLDRLGIEYDSSLGFSDRPGPRAGFSFPRRRLGLAYHSESPAFILPTGEPIRAGELTRWLRTARLVRMILEVNGWICRSLLRVRHGIQVDKQRVP